MLYNGAERWMAFEDRTHRFQRPGDTERANAAAVALKVKKIQRSVALHELDGRLVQHEEVDVVDAQEPQALLEATIRRLGIENLVSGKGPVPSLEILLHGRHGVYEPPGHALDRPQRRRARCGVEPELGRDCHVAPAAQQKTA
jgi:hypothetical protein